MPVYDNAGAKKGCGLVGGWDKEMGRQGDKERGEGVRVRFSIPELEKHFKKCYFSPQLKPFTSIPASANTLFVTVAASSSIVFGWY